MFALKALVSLLGVAALAHAATVSFDGSKVPNIVSNDLYAIQCAGKPSRLNRSSNGTANRAKTQCHSPNRCSGTNLPSCDEYPYASSEQSSATSVTRCVPAHENSVQGGVLSAFYNRGSGISDGDAYDVAFYNYDGLEYADGSCDNSGNEVQRRGEIFTHKRRIFKTSEGHELLMFENVAQPSSLDYVVGSETYLAHEDRFVRISHEL
ncbi:unnamed protein product [Sympodiomycopsis kandeliae]